MFVCVCTRVERVEMRLIEGGINDKFELAIDVDGVDETALTADTHTHTELNQRVQL